MTKFSLIASAIIIILFAVVFMIQKVREEQRLKALEQEKLEWIEQQEKQRSSQPPKYGFPELDSD